MPDSREGVGWVRQSFAAGDFTAAALGGSPDQWETYAALGLVGRTADALTGLANFESAEARFYAAVTHWIGGDEAEAVRGLEELHTPHARNLLSLIRKPRIRVLAQLPWFRTGASDLLRASVWDRKFDVRNVSFHAEDVPNHPYADVRQFLSPGELPDFYICQMVEWHVVPPNLRDLPCPVFGQTSDYDAHIHAVYPWLQLFDELIVTDHTEWKDVSRLVRVPVSTFPKSFGVSTTLPPVPSVRRPIDVCLSGNLLDTYQWDKARLIHQVLQTRGLRMKLVNGFLPAAEYWGLLGQAKVSCAYVRRPGGTPTRGLEALSMGCALLVQEESVLRLFVGETDGVFTYDLERDNLGAQLGRIVEDWDEHGTHARRGAAIIRKEFALPLVASQYLRFLTFLAARPRGGRSLVAAGVRDQRRSILRYGALPGDATIQRRIADANASRWRAALQEAVNPHAINLLCREILLECASEQEPAAALRQEQIVSDIVAMYRTGVSRCPNALMLRFNWIRTALHFGRPAEVSEALHLAAETLRHPEDVWILEPEEDVFPWDFCSRYFNYRQYLDCVTRTAMGEGEVRMDLVRLIRAALNHYLGCYSGDLGQLHEAVALDEVFPYYALTYAKRLAECGTDSDREEAIRVLLHLTARTVVFLEAGLFLEKMVGSTWRHDPRFHAVSQLLQQAEESVCLLNYPQPTPLRPALVAGEPTGQPKLRTNALPAWLSGPSSHHSAERLQDSWLVTAVVSAYNAERFMRALLEDLEEQTLAKRLEIVIVDSGSPQNERSIVEEFRRRYDNIVYLRTDERENAHAALNRAIRMARGRYLTLANVDDRHRPDAFERMAAVLDGRPEVALVYADSAITEQENGTCESARLVGHLRLPDFDRREIFRGCCVGPQPMWRRELHERYGVFDPAFEICGDYEFWLRIGVQETFVHLPEVLGLYLMSPTSNERVNRIRRHQETERARRKHWPREWGELPPWDADYNVMLESSRSEEPAMAESGAGRIVTAERVPRGVPDEEREMSTGDLALERQAWSQACAAFINILERDKHCAPARSGLGVALVALGDVEEGLAQLQEAVRLKPSPDLVCNLASGLIHAERHAEAEHLLRGILEVVPAHEAARANLVALVTARCGRPPDPVVQSPLPSGKEEIARRLEAAAGHMTAKRWGDALDGFRAVLAVSPDLAEARAALGSVLLVLGRHAEAAGELRRAAVSLNTSEAWNNLGWAEAVAGHSEEARTALIAAIERDPSNLEPQRNLAALFETLGMPRDAEAAYDLILLTMPGDREAVAGKTRCATVAASPSDTRKAAEVVLVHG